MDLSPPMAMAVEKSDIQETAAFEQVTVYLTEDISLDFDPYLFALSGNNLQQYCTLLSWLEMRKRNSQLFLETAEGVATPLSLVHIEEEFNTSPSLYQELTMTPSLVTQAGVGVAQTKEQENAASLARLQYNFVQEANLPTRSSEFFLTGENGGLFPERPKAHPYTKGLMKDFSTAIAHQGGSLHVTYVSLKQDGSGVVPQSQEQNNPQRAVAAGDGSPQEGHPSERSHPEKKGHPGNNVEADVNQLPASEVHRGTWDRAASFGASHSAAKHLGPVPVTNQQVSLQGNPTFRCSKYSHPFECSSANCAGQDVPATNKLVKLTSSSSSPKEKAGKVVEKPFHCPDCGKGFLHLSSIPRHQRLHKRESSSPDSEKQAPDPCADCGTSFPIKPLVIKHQKPPRSDQPFKCLLCDKSYGQKYHLKRHEQQKHQGAY